ncbi:P-loop containing nucleoside triphosphate hydrolase protein [Amniculicola lignicola CBS 123094]|uniref:P-loop containing nucleoside triphosphate hydrolase protein n=1 Tax=Amniculicola lignicola CBS 123094 TaxID=1392246 RepID=A0A6A5WA46_9PLEO|nr:P-loop containing nucleoside triphosphate hydrolase protein [Amniculicola lignicola CBS 123094]
MTLSAQKEKSPGRGSSESKREASPVDSEKPKEAQGGLGSYFRVFKYADRSSWMLNATAFTCAIASGVLLPLMNLVFGKFVTTATGFATGALTPTEYRSEINKYTLYFVYLFVGKFALVYIFSITISASATRTTKALRIDFLERTLKQNIAFFDSADVGSITAQATTNGNNVSTGIGEKLTQIIQGISTFASAFIIAFAVQWKLAFITVSIVPAIIIVVGICIGQDMKLENVILALHGKTGLLAEEVFSTVRTVHAFWLNPLLSSRFDALLADAMKVGNKKSRVYAVLFSFEFFCVYAAYGLAFWRGIRMYVSGEIKESGDVFTVILAVIVAATAMSTIAPAIQAITKASSAAEELFKTIDRPSEIDPLSEEGLVPNECIGHIEVQNLHFAYPARPDIPVLKGLNLSVPANKTTALVGASGSGKSTIVGLLERWYDHAEGQLLLDGVDIRSLNLKWLRTKMRLVQQEPVLFSGTVYENVAFGLVGTGKSNLSDAEQKALVEKACHAAYADEFIEQLPQGYNTQVGERAMMLSGGQKQRLAIARSIVSDPTVLLLDEATSALDPKAEKIVQQALDNVSTGRTTIVIAHKLSTIRNADNIAVMSDGGIVEQGTHDELLDASGAYARLVRAQDLGRSGDEDGRDEEKSNDRIALVRTQTQVESVKGTGAKDEDKEVGPNYSLIRCIFIVFREQGHLWAWFTVLGIAAVLGGFTYPAQAILFAKIVQAFELAPDKARDQGDFYSLMFFVVALANLGFFASIGWGSNIIAQNVSRRYRNEIFRLILKQDMAFFDKEENATGALASNLSGYPNNLVELLGFNIVLIVINVVNVVSSSILALVVGWKLGLVVVFGALPPVLFSGYLRIRLDVKLQENTRKLFASSASLAAEAVSAIRTVSSLALERHIIERYQQRLHGVVQQDIKSLVWTMFWYSLTQSISFLAMALGFWYGGRLISYGEYSTTQFFIVFIAVIFSGEAAASFFSYTTSMTKAQTAANYVFGLRRLTPIVQEDSSRPPHDGDDSEKRPAHMECKELAYAYESRPNTKVLSDINVDVRPGQFVAFVGASGCGKSTMIALLERFYDPISGTITSDSRPLDTLCPRKYRNRISLVQQEPVLYQGSIRENIAMGIEGGEVTEDQVDEAARQSNIFDFVTSLPEGLNTLVGSRGTQLSGGQRQRIAIARALIRKPRLLLLDEATSALDTESEKVVQAALEKAKSGRTTIAVAHRLSTIKDADVIVVFARGRIVEVGTHKELLGRRGVYYEMCKGQSMDRAV